MVLPSQLKDKQPSVASVAREAVLPSQLKRYKDELALDYPDLDPSLLDFILHIYKEASEHRSRNESPSGCPHYSDEPPEADQPGPAAAAGPPEAQVPQPGDAVAAA
jgi:hypothetical protein